MIGSKSIFSIGFPWRETMTLPSRQDLSQGISRGAVAVLALSLFITLAAVHPASAQTETVLYDFTTGDGAVYPAGNLIMDSSGNLYGVSQSDTEGSVFELIPSSGGMWTLKILYEFKDLNDGIPAYDLVMDSAGNLYGTCLFGGTSYYGTVYELKHISNGTWRKQVLHNFVNDGIDGNYPGAALIFDKAGNLYGTTQEGGLKNVGVVFELSPYSGGTGWKEKILYSLPYKDIHYAVSNYPLSIDASGNLYGVTNIGGVNDAGYVFKLTPAKTGPWTFSTLYSFQAVLSGPPADPDSGVVFDSAGNLYGATILGGAEGSGTVYQLSPSADGTWREHDLFDFPSSCSPACGPHIAVTVDAAGNIFGTASSSGSQGAVYELSPDGNGTWNLSILHDFNGGDDGADPSVGSLLDVSGNLYGTTRSGGGSKGRGVVYEIAP
jgi:uncharacterized repeat protein (TIGR03803 family)